MEQITNQRNEVNQITTKGKKSESYYVVSRNKVGETLASRILKIYHNNLTHTNKVKTANPLDTLSQLEPCTLDKRIKIIDNLKLNTSPGLDGINIKSIKFIKD